MNKLGFVSLVFAATAFAQQSGVTTRYWDCCKPSCSWSGKAPVSRPVLTCNAQGSSLSDPDVKSGCDGGSAFTCTNNSPFAVDSNLAYGFAAVSISGSTESAWCCGCYELTFTSGPVQGKRMVVQATNTGGDLGSNHFDILMPGGGVGIFTQGCPAQFGSWNGGAQYGGLTSRSQCSQLPSSLVAGCQWRFDWFQNADNPTVSWRKVQCPGALTSISGCTRSDEGGLPTVTQGPPTSTTPSTPSSSSSNPGPTGGGGGSGAPQYGQCGGIGWSGATTCVSPFTCTKLNDYGLLQAFMQLVRKVLTCNSQGSSLTDPDIASGCDGGSAFTCVNNSPFAIDSNLSYGFAAVSISGGTESSWCCACYELTFTSGSVQGKRFVVQSTNTGGDLGSNHFDLLIPGGGVGIFTQGCPAQFGSWNGGAQYGGLTSRDQCTQLPACCVRTDDAGYPAVTQSPPVPTSSPSAPPSSLSTTPTPTPTGGSGGGGATQYTQCGGIGWSGATTCVSPFTCTRINDYYFQCL
ncbi:hypothetical protein ONZ45_g11439 [Pleurotus djamor]|nr:hypothetical protein ONZ45_g11439 [Pleurotus djamor]